MSVSCHFQALKCYCAPLSSAISNTMCFFLILNFRGILMPSLLFLLLWVSKNWFCQATIHDNMSWYSIFVSLLSSPFIVTNTFIQMENKAMHCAPNIKTTMSILIQQMVNFLKLCNSMKTKIIVSFVLLVHLKDLSIYLSIDVINNYSTTHFAINTT